MLGSIYESVFDMDLITGVMLEKKINRIIGVVGRCIMADQMYRLKYGDRFFYKFTNGPDAYSKGNLIICRHLCGTKCFIRVYLFHRASQCN